mgnify:FL=1
MVRDYLVSLKNKGNFSWNDLSEMSGLPDTTIRKIFSGETADPRFETVVRLVSAMGGSLDDILGKKEEEKIEINAILALKDTYELRISEMKLSSSELISSLRKDKKYLAIVSVSLLIFLLAFIVVDFFMSSVGWIRY